MPKLKVLIIGAGLGGLCLAQAIRDVDIDVQIFERDANPWDRAQGYRLHLEADGLNALREVLPVDLHDLFKATAMRTFPFTTILGPDLSVIKRIPTDDGQDRRWWPQFQSEENIHCNVDRAILRRILLTDLDYACHFGRKFMGYESDAGGVTAFFADGTSARGDVLVGADGIRSAVRDQRAPHAKIASAGVQAIYGRIPFNVAAKLAPAEALQDIFAIGIDTDKVFLGLGAVAFPLRPDKASAQFCPRAKLDEQEDYVVCVVGGRHERFPKPPKALHALSSEELQGLAVGMLRGWPGTAADLIAHGDPYSFFSVDMYTSVPCAIDTPSNVTLLGDAIHGMTPTLGRGANLAMRDGALLSRRIIATRNSVATIPAELAAYESEMLLYGFDVLRESVQMGQQRMGQNPLPD